jgi:NAD(P)-dependent dehydrogenase (short-subunit alcohol dehydrogenase family)
MHLEGKVSLVTGGGRGIGRAIALEMAREGAAVAVAARTVTQIEAVAAEIAAAGGRAVAAPTDVCDPEQVRRMVEWAEAALGPVDVLVNNAGGEAGLSGTRLAEMSLEQWQAQLQVNLTSAFLCAQAVLPAMVARGGGVIVNIASVVGLDEAYFRGAYIGMGGYVAAKAGLIGLTRALADELAGNNIRVHAVCPGYVETELVRGELERLAAERGITPDAMRARLGRFCKWGRMLQPEEVAPLVAFLASDAASAMTRQVITIP